MLKLRVIPCLDVKDGRVVKGVNFVSLRDAGDPVEQAQVYDAAGADELTFLDITASHENRDTILDVVARTAARVFLPLTVGGGIRAVEDMRRCCWPAPTSAASTPPRSRGPTWCARRRRNSAANASWSRSTRKRTGAGRWEVFTHGGRRGTGIDAIGWCRHVAALGAGEILLTSMDRDGTGLGFDLGLLRAVCARGAGAGDRLGRRRLAAAFRRGRRGGRHRPAGRERVPFRHVHHRRGEGRACTRRGCRCGSPSGRPRDGADGKGGQGDQEEAAGESGAARGQAARQAEEGRSGARSRRSAPRPPPPLALGPSAAVLDRSGPW